MPLVATEVEAGYARTPVLRGVSCSVEPGRVTALIGPNGAGKSTLLRALLGAIPIRAGRIELDGVPLSRLRVRDRAARLALVPQSTTPGSAYSARQVIRLGRLAFHEPPAAAEAAARGAIERLGLEGCAEAPLASLSAGQQQRVLLARALAQLGLTAANPTSGEGAGRDGRFLLADEPVASMDPHHAINAMEVLAQTAAAGVGVLVVVHDFAVAKRWASDAIVLGADGRITASGPAAGVLTPEALGPVFRTRFAMAGPLPGQGVTASPGVDARWTFPLPLEAAGADAR